MTGDNPVIEFSSYYQHAVKVYEGDFHGLAWNVILFITSDQRINLTYIECMLCCFNVRLVDCSNCEKCESKTVEY